MTDDDHISRRTALKGITVGGALVGSSVFSVNTASAGQKDKKDEKDRHKDKKGKHKDKKGKDHKDKKDKKDGHKDKKDHDKYENDHDPDVRVAFNFECADPGNDRAKFYLHHGEEFDMTFTYRVVGTQQKGTITVEESLASAETFWVNAPDGEATVKVYYKGALVGEATSDPAETCE
ncbi:twin-arginine translocation signal domain-containing protein [Natrialbaceae archaeon A-arb3/5]